MVGALLRGRIAFNAGAADHPIVIPVALVLLLPFALHFGLPLLFKAALLLPYAAVALSRGAERRATFDPARDLRAELDRAELGRRHRRQSGDRRGADGAPDERRSSGGGAVGSGSSAFADWPAQRGCLIGHRD